MPPNATAATSENTAARAPRRANASRLIEQAAGMSGAPDISGPAARDIKPHLAAVTDEIEALVADEVDPAAPEAEQIETKQRIVNETVTTARLASRDEGHDFDGVLGRFRVDRDRGE